MFSGGGGGTKQSFLLASSKGTGICTTAFLVIPRKKKLNDFLEKQTCTQIEVHHFASPFAPNSPVGGNSAFRQGKGGEHPRVVLGRPEILVALYRAMRLRCGYGFESCDANGPRNVKNTNITKCRPIFLPPVLLVGSKELVLKVPKRGHFHVAIRVTRKRCDSCAQVAQGTQTVSRRNF